MARALDLAERGRGAVEPNPLVGSVVAQGSKIVGEGWHQRFGGPHAEVHALDQAAEAAREATLYVTLEPCCHQGKTPPCTDRILAEGIRRVVIALADPFPQVAGRGIEILTNAGIEVVIGCLEDQARAQNSPYLKLLQHGRPYVHAKWAMTLDGRIATATGQSKWISGEASRQHAHAFRGLVDAIIVGVGTVLADDPLLTARPPGPRLAARVVLDSHARTPIDSQLVCTAAQVPTLIVTTPTASQSRVDQLLQAGCECLTVPAADSARVAVDRLLDELGQRRWTNVLVEGGAELLGSFLTAGEIDAVRIYLAPRLVGGRAAKGPIAGAGIAALADSLQLGPLEITRLDGDVFACAAVMPHS